jgi:3-methyladenine DNA glycosylase AlkD
MMLNAKSVMTELKKKGKESTRNTYVRHGAPIEKTFGVSVADMKLIAKTIKGQQAIAYELYETGNMDAMYLAGIVADGSLMTRKKLEEWAEGSGNIPLIMENTVPWVTVESKDARELALRWMKSKKDHVASAGWATYVGLLATKPDNELDLKEIGALLETVVREIGKAQNRVKSKMNSFVIAVGKHVKPLLKQAKATAKEIGEVSVDVGDTDCEVPVASDRIAKFESEGRVGEKRKTLRC